MKKYLLFAVLTSVIYLTSCNKRGQITKDNKRLIVGTWEPQVRHDRISTLAGTLVLDTTYEIISTDTAYWNEKYNSNGSASIINTHTGQTTASYTYSINAYQLTKYQFGDPNQPVYYSILQLTSSKMGIENQFQSKIGNNSKFDPDTFYFIVSDTYYNRK